MRKRTKFLVIAIAAVLVLTVGLATTAFATGSSDDEGAGEQALTANGEGLVLASEGEEQQGPCQRFVDKVLDKLGVTKEQLIGAINEARSEMCDEWVEQRVNDALADGLINEDEAAAILEWWQNRPEALENLGPLACLQLRNTRRHQRLQCLGPQQLPPRECFLVRICDQRLNGTITSVSEETSTIVLDVGEDNEVSFQYTSNTTFVLRGVTAIEEGQTAIAWCWEDADGNLTAKIVRIGLP